MLHRDVDAPGVGSHLRSNREIHNRLSFEEVKGYSRQDMSIACMMAGLHATYGLVATAIDKLRLAAMPSMLFG